MARTKKRTPQVENVRLYVEGVAKNLVDKLYGPDGPAWGTKLTDLEEVFLEIRQVLTEKLLQESLARQAAVQPQQSATVRTCPGCQQSVACDDANPRIVQTRTGAAAWSEPEGYCPRCRRAFFPSVAELGD
jgi:hypothetical protein